jgi:hypothetical protein
LECDRGSRKISGAIVEFSSSQGSLAIDLENTTQYLDTNTLTLKTHTAQDYISERRISQSNIPSFAFKEVSSNEITIAGYPASRMDYILTYIEVGVVLYYNEIYTVKDNTVVGFQYIAGPLDVPTTLPIANKMIDSFKFTGGTQ